MQQDTVLQPAYEHQDGAEVGQKSQKQIDISRLILGLGPANERCRYFVTVSLIGRVQT